MRFGELIGRGRLISSPNQKRSPRPAYSYERIKGIGLALLAMPILLVRPAIGIEIDTIFEKSCAGKSKLFETISVRFIEGCHLGGGNVLGGRTLKLKDLEAMEMLNTESLFKNIYYGNRRMPGFGTDCQPQVFKE